MSDCDRTALAAQFSKNRVGLPSFILFTACAYGSFAGTHAHTNDIQIYACYTFYYVIPDAVQWRELLLRLIGHIYFIVLIG